MSSSAKISEILGKLSAMVVESQWTGGSVSPTKKWYDRLKQSTKPNTANGQITNN